MYCIFLDISREVMTLFKGSEVQKLIVASWILFKQIISVFTLKGPNNSKNGRDLGNPSLKCEALIWPFINTLVWLLINFLWKIYGKSIHILNLEWIGRIELYGFCSNLDWNGLIRNYWIFRGVGCVALLYYVVAWENFR